MKQAFIFLSIVLLLVMGCSRGDTESSSDRSIVLTIMTHDSFSVSREVLADFEKKHHVKVSFLKSGDAGEALNKAILSKNNPLGDIFYGVDNTFFSRAVNEELFIPYDGPGLENLPDHLKLDPQNRLVPVDFGDVCLNYDIDWFAKNSLAPPKCLEDLIKPKYKGLLVVENPATSSPGLAFLLATISRFGEEGHLDFWRKLKANDLLVSSGWKEAYWGEFTAASKGARPMVVSYASSPAAEVFFAKEKPDTAPTGVVVDNGSAFRQIEFAGIFKGTPHPDLAGKLMAFLLSRRFQEDIPLQMFVFPASREAVLPEIFQKHAVITKDPAEISPDEITRNRERWIQAWTQAVL